MLYLDALLAADDSKVPLAHDVRRTHTLANGRAVEEDRMVSGEAEIRDSIRKEELLFRRDLRLFVDESLGQVIALMQVSTPFPGARLCTVMDRLLIVDGWIKEIEIISVPKEGKFDAGLQ
jgi:hypothetical protein